MDKILKYKLQHRKSPRVEHRQENFRHPMQQYLQQYFHQYFPKSKGHNGKNIEMGFHQNKNVFILQG